MDPSLPIKLLVNGSATTGMLSTAESESPEEAEPCSIELVLQERHFAAAGSDFFEALVRLRQQLEPLGILVCVNGASRDVWPSAMARSMGAGRKAYRMKLGYQARTTDLVEIFALDPESHPCSVVEQERFLEKWFASLGGAA